MLQETAAATPAMSGLAPLPGPLARLGGYPSCRLQVQGLGFAS